MPAKRAARRREAVYAFGISNGLRFIFEIALATFNLFCSFLIKINSLI